VTATHDDEIAAHEWLEQTLARARELVRQQPLGPRDQTWEQFEASTRGMVTAFLRSTDAYLGLTVDAAEERARLLKDHLCVHRGPTGHRADLRSDRVHVTVGADGHITAARLDRPPWAVSAAYDPD
jgi:hypothetical protein